MAAKLLTRTDGVNVLCCAMPWLLKTEPSEYSFADLSRDKQTRWDGISNPQALKNMRAAKKGEVVVIYHTGGERAAVGLAEIAKEGDPVEVKVKKPLAKPIELATFKADKLFKDSPLVKQGRLSFVPLTDAQLARILQLAQ
jgi:predicted RNA-binding protein with PUA-like domain